MPVKKKIKPNSPKNNKLLTFRLDSFQTSIDISKKQEKNQKVINYLVLGNDKSYVTQEKNLSDKLKNLLTPTTKSIEIDNQLSKEEIEKEKELSDSENSQKNDLFAFENRYFITNPSKICFRCHKTGHYEKTCTEELSKIICFNCLGEHNSWTCPSVVCFNCHEIGHRNKECPNSKEKLLKCEKCFKFHKKEKCGMMNFEKNINSNDKNKIICLFCGKSGHLNCKKINLDNFDNIYNENIDYNKIYNIPNPKKAYQNNARKNMRNRYDKLNKEDMDSFDELENFDF